MDVVTLSRIQFALTIGFHFIFVPLTLGLGLFVAIMESLYVWRKDARYKELAKFWGKLFTINFVLGVVTGLTMEFQFGTNWSRYSEFMGDIFGSPLAVEALMAFFLESTFMGIWLFGWEKLSKRVHLFAAWMVALGTHLSAIWIIVANGFMQNPVGYALQNGRAELVDFGAVLGNPYAWHTYVHTILAGYSVGAFFVLGVTAYHLLRRQNLDLMKRSVNVAVALALVATVGNAVSGHFNGQNVAKYQPAKLAAMESHWETATNVPMSLFLVPDVANEQNRVDALHIGSLASWLAYNDPNAPIKGLKEFPADERPPVALTFWSFRVMVGVGIIMLLIAVTAWYLNAKNRLLLRPRFLKVMLWAIPLPYIATNLGWMTAEVGRQPWTVYGLFRTAESVSPVPVGQVWTSLGLILVIYTLLVGLDIFLLARFAKAGPAVQESHLAGAH